MLSSISRHTRSFAAASGPIVGIDLGTTNSCVAVVEGGTPKVIPSSIGAHTTPSVVAFNEKGKMIVGDQAKRQSITNPQSTFFATKRLIGRRYEDEMTKRSQTMVPYSIIEDKESGEAWVKDAQSKIYSPAQIGAYVLQSMKDTASKYLRTDIKNAVITVPAYFNDSQRQATKDAGKIAGLNVTRIINEPTAAALAYGVERKQGQTIAVFDLGGGTFDISILEISKDGIFEVKATNGDTFLGGEDFDQVIIDHIVKKFRETNGTDITGDMLAMQRIREAAEKAKCDLSGLLETEIYLPYIASTPSGVQHLKMSLSRSDYEAMVRPLIDRTISPVSRCLKDAELKPSQINEVILVGGMTRTPAVVNRVKEFFKKDPYTGVNPDEVVAMGAAIQGSVLQGKMNQIVLLDVTPLSLGIETMGGVFAKLIPRNTVVPCKTSETFSTAVDGQTNVNIKVYQGEREMVKGNKLLGDFTLKGIPPMPRGIPKIKVTFEIDANSIVHVSAEETNSGTETEIQIKQHGGLSQDQIAQMIKDAEAHHLEDVKSRLMAEKRLDMESFIFNAEKRMAECANILPKELTDEIKKELGELHSILNTATDGQLNRKFNGVKKLTDKMQQIIREENAKNSP
ncbi:Chaperone protein DnaK [Tritrichomonas foetus]|uniref:Chaperone protein DnaK n=1 Tax=Tritrichomonas foetus TaxID=1144522 RepID=A0A1J4KED1_9EUKA|nr:Chaperone protein DnaK [Tritrichomonas foetus]|eukprot:OHT07813.1 Chaperone protein DnaK [Tritrichomonas foetus]